MTGLLDFVNVVGIVALAIWLVLRLREWTRSEAGRARLLTWRPGAFISAQSLIAVAWLVAAGTSPWSFYFLYKTFGFWSILPIRFMLAAILILIPAGLIVTDAAWIRLHRIPVGWTLPRILAIGALILVTATTMTLAIEARPVAALLVVLAFANVLTTLFLTVWWFFSHPLPAK
jgi:hypothetical protein